jgi:hypothetical protein
MTIEIQQDANPDRIEARTLPLVFSDYTRCASCRATYEIRVVYCVR